jgi:uncharacterized protein YukJ
VPLATYGVLRATILDRRRATGHRAHYQLLCGLGEERWRAAINARSDAPPSDVAYALLRPFDHPALHGLEEGWTPLARGLDYVRDTRCAPGDFRPLPADRPGPGNDLSDLLDRVLRPGARVYVFGEPWGPDRAADPHFGFPHGRGLHDVHQNQGNIARFRADDGVGQDGGLVVEGEDGARTAILLRFQSQAWRTDDRTGHAR